MKLSVADMLGTDPRNCRVEEGQALHVDTGLAGSSLLTSSPTRRSAYLAMTRI